MDNYVMLPGRVHCPEEDLEAVWEHILGSPDLIMALALGADIYASQEAPGFFVLEIILSPEEGVIQ